MRSKSWFKIIQTAYLSFSGRAFQSQRDVGKKKFRFPQQSRTQFLEFERKNEATWVDGQIKTNDIWKTQVIPVELSVEDIPNIAAFSNQCYTETADKTGFQIVQARLTEYQAFMILNSNSTTIHTPCYQV